MTEICKPNTQRKTIWCQAQYKQNSSFFLLWHLVVLPCVRTSAAPGSSSATGRPVARPSLSSLTSSQGATFTPWMCPTGRFPRPLYTTAPPPLSHPHPNKREHVECIHAWMHEPSCWAGSSGQVGFVLRAAVFCATFFFFYFLSLETHHARLFTSSEAHVKWRYFVDIQCHWQKRRTEVCVDVARKKIGWAGRGGRSRVIIRKFRRRAEGWVNTKGFGGFGRKQPRKTRGSEERRRRWSEKDAFKRLPKVNIVH